MKHLRNSTTIIFLLLASTLAMSCVKAPPVPTGGGAPLAPTAGSLASVWPTPIGAPLPSPLTPPASSTETAAPASMETPASSPLPTAQPDGTPQPTIPYFSKIGGSLLSLMRDRKAPYVKTVPHLNEVMEKMERDGGPQVGIWFDHILTDEKIVSLEARYGVRFLRIYGKVQDWSPIFSVLVPWDQIIPVSELPEVKSIDTDLWPPPVPLSSK